MWKDYSKSYLKNNRASSLSIIVAVFVATMFLSLLCTLGYNFWNYEIEQVVLDKGDWQGRIIGEIGEEDLALVRNFSNVEKAIVNENFSEEGTVIDLYFEDVKTVYHDMSLIMEQIGLEENEVQYNTLLLSKFFVHDPKDEQPPLLLAFYLGILIMASCSLILIIRNSFELSMNARIRQFGILSSIGATPKQIRTCLMQEAAALCAVPMFLGCILGIAVSFGFVEIINTFAADVSGRHEAVFQYHFIVFGITILASALTVFFSAWIPARKLSRMTPLQAIRNAGDFRLKRGKRSSILSFMFGIEGELAGNAIKAQKKALRISTLSLLLSFLGFSIMLCFTTLADISTRFTYFERYQNVWDVMVTLEDTMAADFKLTEKLQDLSGVRDVTVYQKGDMTSSLSKDVQSDELAALGGFGAIAGQSQKRKQMQVDAPIVIMDDDSFLEYCSQIGITPSLEGAIVLNRIWDNINSNFRYKEYVPFVKESMQTTTLSNDSEDGQPIEIPILSYTQVEPVLREEYDNYTLVHFIPLSMWKGLSGQLREVEADSYIRILASEDATFEDLNALEKQVVRLVEQNHKIETENRIHEKVSNDSMMTGLVAILSLFCVLLAIIGIANVFYNTLGFLRQRKREFAQYMSIGLTPMEMREMFCIEAFVIAGKPLIITIPLTVVFAEWAVTASYLDSMVFWGEAPIMPILVFGACIVGFVAVAYYIGGKRILTCDLNETLRNDTLV